MVGAPERYLDMRRFFSDEIVTYMKGLKDVLNRCAPGVPVSSNHWSENPAVALITTGYGNNCRIFPAMVSTPVLTRKMKTA